MSFGGSNGGGSSIATSSDVALSNPADGQTLTYDAGIAKWKNAPPTSGSNGLIEPIPVSSFAGATADDRLTAALQYAAAQTYKPTIQLNEPGASYSTTQTLFSGMRLVGPDVRSKQNREISGSGTQMPVSYTGSGTWFVASSQVVDVTIGYFSAQSVSGLGSFLSATDLRETVLTNLQLVNFKNAIGSPTAFCACTDVDFGGDWTINAGSGPQICISGSDNNLWVEGSCNIGAGGASGGGSPLMMLKTGKTAIGPMYFTARKNFYGINLQGDLTSYVGNTFTGGIRVEGQNTVPANASDGALIIVEGGAWCFRDINCNYGMNDVTTANSQSIPGGSGMTARNDRGMIQINGGDVIIDGATYDRTTGVATTVPFACVAGGVLEIARIRTGAKGGSWNGDKPVVRNLAGAGTLIADASVNVITV